MKAGKTYRYRVRLILEDPNYPRLESFSPKTSNMKPEVVSRVQELVATDKAIAAKAPAGKTPPRNSKRTSPWSDPSSPIEILVPTELYASQTAGQWETKRIGNTKSEVTLETSIKATLVYGEWSKEFSLLVPKKQTLDRGSVLSGPAPEGGLDVIHPT